jgi:predicted helicase
MSQLLINQYLGQLDVLKKVGGTHRESVVREAFKDLLKDWGKQHDLVFIPEYKLDSATKDTRFVDGALLYELRVPFGYWEAKDSKDDLDAEIEFKFKRGYPQDNIIFEDSTQAVLIQRRAELMRCDVTDVKQLEKLLKLFFSFERAEIVDFRKAVAQFKTDLPAVLEALRSMIEKAHEANAAFAAASKAFLAHAQEAINPSLTDADVREMLIQHILTEEIFSKVFNSEFHRDNNVARELYKLEATFFTGGLKQGTLKGLEPYYASIRAAAAQIGSHQEKQTFLKVIYENFYKVYNAKAADRLGVVYTPNEIVRFMIEGADWLCEKHFGRNLIDSNVEILDPATGTGTFICELLEHFRGQPVKLKHKYREELHANEVAILPYYVANLNIEATYAAITGEYEEFKNLCFVDTLDNVGLHTSATGVTHDLFGSVSEENVARIKRQNGRRISVIIGNPPYNANQANENDNNKNREYPSIDARIKQTYIAESTAQKTKLYDMYARFFRWASDRLSADGVLAFVTNRSFIDSRTFDGFRTTVLNEFSEAWVVDLGGDWKKRGDANASGGNVFGIGTGVAVSFFVKKHVQTKTRPQGRIRYVPAGKFVRSGQEKLAWLGAGSISRLAFDEIRPDAKGNWLNVSNNDFEELLPIISKATKLATNAKGERAIFKLFGLGVSTNRDEWVYDDSKEALVQKIRFLQAGFAGQKLSTQYDTAIKWSRNLKRRHYQRRREPFALDRVVRAIYRPYCATWFYDSSLFVDEQGIRESLADARNIAVRQIVVTDPTGQKPWLVCAVAGVVDLHFVGAGAGAVCLPVVRAAQDHAVDNVTDWALSQFHKHYQPGRGKKLQPITKEAIFHYVYAVLHDPLYRKKYEQNLKRDYPRIPLYGESETTFWQWAGWGERLMAMHIGYDSVEPFALKRTDVPDQKAHAAGQSPKPVLKPDKAAGVITLDSETTLAGVPAGAWTYQLGNRCAIEWVLDQYKEKTPKDPTIREKFNTYRFADYKEAVVDLLMRVTTVSVETMNIVDAMKQADR